MTPQPENGSIQRGTPSGRTECLAAVRARSLIRLPRSGRAHRRRSNHAGRCQRRDRCATFPIARTTGPASGWGRASGSARRLPRAWRGTRARGAPCKRSGRSGSPRRAGSADAPERRRERRPRLAVLPLPDGRCRTIGGGPSRIAERRCAHLLRVAEAAGGRRGVHSSKACGRPARSLPFAASGFEWRLESALWVLQGDLTRVRGFVGRGGVWAIARLVARR